MDKQQFPEPPMRAIVANKLEADWERIDASFNFRFSLYPRCYLEVVKPDGSIFEGYFSGAHSGGLALLPCSIRTTRTRLSTIWDARWRELVRGLC